MSLPTRLLTRFVALCFVLLALACGPGPAPPVPQPDLSEAEPMVAGVLNDLRAAVVAQPAAAETWGRLGAAYHAHDLHEEAIVCYRRAHELALEEFRWAYLLAVASLEHGAGPETFGPLFATAARLEPGHVPLYLRLGRALLAHGQTDEAERAFRRAIELEPAASLARRGLGQTLLAQGRPGAAVESLLEAAELAPADGAAHAALAQAYAALGLADLAAAAAGRAKRSEPESGIDDPLLAQQVESLGASSRHWFARARARIDRAEWAGALEDLAVVERTRPQDPDVHYLKGVALGRSGQRDRGLAEQAEALRAKPDHARARLELARLLSELDREDEALAELRQGVQLTPREPALLVALSATLISRGDPAGAGEVYRQLIRLAPDDPRLQFNLGSLEAQQGRFAEAAEALREALRVDPGYVDAHQRLGLVLERLGDPELAVQHYHQAVRLGSSAEAVERLAVLGKRDPNASVREEFERIADRLYGGTNKYLGRANVDRLRQALVAGEKGGRREMDTRAQLALRLLEAGDTTAAVEQIERAMQLAAVLNDPEAVLEMHRHRALAYMRQAEVQNCIARHNADCCIFPLEGGGVHAAPLPAARARESFEALLRADPGDLRALWLLNVMAMALGDYPQGLSAGQRLPPKAFTSEYDIGRFRDVAPDLGVDTFNLAGGVVVDDFDGDDRLDIVTSTFDPRGPLAFYRNDRRGGFIDATAASGLDEQLGGLNCIGADYDGDGDLDLLVPRGAWLMDDGRIRKSLLRNDGHGGFTDVTRAAGLALPAYPTQTAAWGDFDNDGDLDLYVANESRKQMPEDRADYPSQLFRNGGDGTFTDVAREAGVTNDRYAKGVTAGDYDNDGDLDLYVSNVLENRLYRNNGDSTFTDVAREAGVTEPAGRSFATWFFDYDNDGWLDLFVAGFQATVADLAAEALGRPHKAERPRLYRNRGDGTFSDETTSTGLARPFLPMGANFGDLDNDGWLDIYLGTGDPSYETLMPNVMLRNDRGGRFQNVTASGGFGHLQKGHGVAFADLDDDGDQDIYHQLGGFFPGDAFHNVLFENPGHGKHWLTLKLVGVRSNRAGYGARIKVLVQSPAGRREIHRAVGSVSSFGGSPARQEIGLGDATSIVRVEVSWPASGLRQTFEALPLDSHVVVTEDRRELGQVRLPAVPFRRR